MSTLHDAPKSDIFVVDIVEVVTLFVNFVEQ